MKFASRTAWITISAVWTTLIVGGGVLLVAAHERPLQADVPQTGIPVEPADAQQTAPWRVTHVLCDGCPCSKAVADHLVRRKPWARGNVVEKVEILCDGSPSDPEMVVALRKAGFPVTTATADEARARLGVNGGPIMIVASPTGKRAYAGGYAGERPAADLADASYQDVVIAGECAAGRAVKPLPAFGCAAGKSPSDVWRDVVELPLTDR